MKRLRSVLIVLMMLSGAAFSAGVKHISIPKDNGHHAIKAIEWSPCATPDGEFQAGPFMLRGTLNCDVIGKNLPLVVISHGYGGTYWSHHDTAEALANGGFIVVALNHPDDNAMSVKTRANSFKALMMRPTDVKRVIDFMLTKSPDAANIDRHAIGFFGFSRGGYTGLVLAGAEPDFKGLGLNQEQVGMFFPKQSQQSDLVHDPRIKAYVIADPISDVFPKANQLKNIKVPFQFWRSQYGYISRGVDPLHVARIAQALPFHPELHTVLGADHYSFLTVCPDKLAQKLPQFCQDRPGFDRATFHQDFDRQVVAFFRQYLGDTR